MVVRTRLLQYCVILWTSRISHVLFAIEYADAVSRFDASDNGVLIQKNVRAQCTRRLSPIDSIVIGYLVSSVGCNANLRPLCNNIHHGTRLTYILISPTRTVHRRQHGTPSFVRNKLYLFVMSLLVIK